MSASENWTITMIELPGVIEGGMPGRNGQRKPGTTRGSPRRSRTAKASRISRLAVKSRCACEWGGWGRLSDDGPGQHNPDPSEGPWGGGLPTLYGGALAPNRPDLSGIFVDTNAMHEGRADSGAAGLPVWLLRPDADHADWQARAAGATGPRRAVLDRAVRTLPTFGTGAGSSAGGDVCAGCFDAQGEGDHRGTVRPQLFGVLDQRNEPAAGREPGTICRPSVGRSLPLSDPRRTLRAGARGRRDRQPGGIDRDRYRLGRPPPGAGGRARQSREPFQLARFPIGTEGARSPWGRVCRRRRSRRPAGSAARGSGGSGLPALVDQRVRR